mgnify:CR=1 FL=1
MDPVAQVVAVELIAVPVEAIQQAKEIQVEQRRDLVVPQVVEVAQVVQAEPELCRETAVLEEPPAMAS